VLQPKGRVVDVECGSRSWTERQKAEEQGAEKPTRSQKLHGGVP